MGKELQEQSKFGIPPQSRIRFKKPKDFEAEVQRFQNYYPGNPHWPIFLIPHRNNFLSYLGNKSLLGLHEAGFVAFFPVSPKRELYRDQLDQK